MMVVLILMTSLVAVVPMATCRSRETANRVKCAFNLRTIGQACLLYANENGSYFPRTRYDAKTTDKPVAYTQPLAKNPFAEDGPLHNDVTAAMFLLLRTQEITPEVFTCPASNAERWDFRDERDTTTRHPTALDRSNFPSEKFLSYGFANPYVTQSVADAGFLWTTSMSSEFAVAADMGPKSDELVQLRSDSPRVRITKANSPNHDGDGQNVLYGDGHVEFQQSPLVGVNGDNIYSVGEAKKPTAPSTIVRVGSPAGPNDSVILPASSYDVGVAALSHVRWRENFSVGSGILALASAFCLVAFILYVRRAVR